VKTWAPLIGFVVYNGKNKNILFHESKFGKKTETNKNTSI
jgi:hypothetical protein